VLGAGDVLVADANTGWREHEARRVANALRNDTVYLEAPCATYEECLSIREHSGLPFILDELMTGMVPLLRAWADRAMDIINLKISRVGGLSKAVQMRNACEALGLGMTIEDSWGGDIATTAIAHLVGSTRPEFLFTSTDFNSYIDLSVAPDAPRRVNGRLSVPNRPGLGITVDEAVLGTPVVTVT
jgi:L-alanine-DL-glutamate epimerase-like enolase superfamily enzyme